MTTKEDVSAYVDNELSEFEERRALNELKNNEEYRGAWGRYHLIRAALRKDLNQIASSNLSKAVAEAIAREPLPQRRRVYMGPFAKITGGFAIAASVAAIAILSLQSPVPPSTTEVAQIPAVQPVAKKDSPSTVPAGVAGTINPLNAYLVDHSESTSGTGVGGLLPYVRMVGHEENK